MYMVGEFWVGNSDTVKWAFAWKGVRYWWLIATQSVYMCRKLAEARGCWRKPAGAKNRLGSNANYDFRKNRLANLYYIILLYIILRYITLYYNTLLYYYIILHYIILYYIILYYITAQYYIISLYYIILYCVILYGRICKAENM